MQPFYSKLLDHGAMWRLSNGKVICTATPYGTEEGIRNAFYRMVEEFNYPESIKLGFLEDVFQYRLNGDYMIVIYDDNEDYEKAIYYYKKTIELDPNYEAAHFFLANIYDELGENEKAIYHYEKTIEIEPAYYYAYINLGCIYEAEDKNLKAYHYFYRAHQVDPADYMALFNLGVACRKLGQIKESIRYYRKSLNSNPEYSFTYLNLAILYKEVFEDYQESIALYTEGIKCNPEVSVFYDNRACCYALLHENEKALEDIKFSTQLSPSLIEYMKTDDELSDIRQMPEYQAIYNE